MSRVQARPTAPTAPPRPTVPTNAAKPNPAIAAVAPVVAPSVAAAAPDAPSTPITAPAAPAAPVAPAVPAAPVANAAEVVTSNAPGAPAAPKKRGRKAGSVPKTEKVDYPGLLSTQEVNGQLVYVMLTAADGSQSHQYQKLTEIPADYDSKIHNKLSAGDFDDESMYYDWRAADLRRQADALEKTGKRLKALGGLADKKQAAKLFKLREQLQALESSLRNQIGDEQYNQI